MNEKIVNFQLPGRAENPLATWKREYTEDHDPYTFIREIFCTDEYRARVAERREQEFQAHATAEQKKVRDADRKLREADRKLAEAEYLSRISGQAAMFGLLLTTIAVAVLCLV